LVESGSRGGSESDRTESGGKTSKSGGKQLEDVSGEEGRETFF
jgi:hypothetical protein